MSTVTETTNDDAPIYLFVDGSDRTKNRSARFAISTERARELGLEAGEPVHRSNPEYARLVALFPTPFQATFFVLCDS